VSAPKILFTPSPTAVDQSQLSAFMEYYRERTGAPLADERALHEASVADVGGFFAAFLDWSGLSVEGERAPALSGDAVETATFFPNLRLSYAENVLRPAGASPDDVAVIALDETGAREELTRAELERRVVALATVLTARGVKEGERVLGLCRNTAQTLVAYLATASIGAIWASAAPDMGLELLLARFGQLAPAVLFADATYPYHGTERDNGARIADLVQALPTLRLVVTGAELHEGTRAQRVSREDLEREAGAAATPHVFQRFAFNHPLAILFSSGTTGLPKCIVHGAGGTLLEHVKEHRLHGDLGPRDRILFHTTVGWMMYNWLVSGLATGASIVLYDGSVSHPEQDALLAHVAKERVTVFGTSPTYLQYLRDLEIQPRASLELSSLRAVMSTGSVLSEPLFDWFYESFADVPLASISGGTDIVGCFVLGSPHRPVYRGESQSITLGYDVAVAVDHGPGEPREIVRCPTSGSVTGELVCARPFPSRPLRFFGDEDGSRFHQAYFTENPGVWTHGDTIELTSRGTARVLGRSDGILNIRGVRIGPSEIYRVLEGFPEITAAAAVEQRAPAEPGGTRLVLLVVLAGGEPLARPLTLKIKKALATRASPAHVPAVIAAVAELPRTHNGKLSERAVRDAVNGASVRNLAAIANPAALEAIRAHPDLQIEESTG
jgi:acetoacetyl-CoA synthetase